MYIYALIFRVLFLLCASTPGLAWALPTEILQPLATGDNNARYAAIAALATSTDPTALTALTALQAGTLRITGAGQLATTLDDGVSYLDLANRAPLGAPQDDWTEIVLNNRLSALLEAALALHALRDLQLAPDQRQAAALTLTLNASPALLPAFAPLLAAETDTAIRQTLRLIEAKLRLQLPDPEAQRAAITALAQSQDPSVLPLLAPLTQADHTPEVRQAAQAAIAALRTQLVLGEWLGHLFSGISLGSILLLAALGLAITYGLMGVINMAHGELIMIGAYATYMVQSLFNIYLPGAFAWYPLAALPVAFISAALVGTLMERTVIRFLYGRPLETLLATWGLSLLLIQTVRTLFGPQNVPVENPVWLSGGIQILPNLILPYNRIAILIFSFSVLLLVWLLLTRTQLGLQVRAVTQNRAMAACMGVATRRVDTWAFGLGSGVAGLAGLALAQVGNVGPDLGQNYIIDSFMVVVLGGVGQLAGTVYAGLGLGLLNKALEPWTGAVIAKIAVLAFIIIFIQRRPQGLFALKGRTVDN